MSDTRKDLSMVKTAHTEEIVNGEERKRLEKQAEDRFEEFCEAYDPIVGYSKIRRPRGVQSDNGDYIISCEVKGWFFTRIENHTVDVKNHWVSKTQGAKKSFCDLTVFMDAWKRGKIAVQSYEQMMTNLRFNRGMGMYYLPDEHYEEVEDFIGEYEVKED